MKRTTHYGETYNYGMPFGTYFRVVCCCGEYDGGEPADNTSSDIYEVDCVSCLHYYIEALEKADPA